MKTPGLLLVALLLLPGCTRDWSKYARPDGGFAGSYAGARPAGQAGAQAGSPGAGGLTCSVPGSLSECYCANGLVGSRICRPDGYYGECDCGSDGGGIGGQTGNRTQAGTGGQAGRSGGCSPGVYRCYCADGRRGEQVCLDNGTYGPCECEPRDLERCGNGIIEGAEQCDGPDLGGVTCEMLGEGYGSLQCTSYCTFDISFCSIIRPVDAGPFDGGWISRCGDGWIDWSRGEVCDGSDLGGVTCASFGYHGGVLRCDPVSCMTFLIDGCWYTY